MFEKKETGNVKMERGIDAVLGCCWMGIFFTFIHFFSMTAATPIFKNEHDKRDKIKERQTDRQDMKIERGDINRRIVDIED
jgi:hypothetical protein